jgi:ubiquinol-cytochrome c reductase cytochrome b subunit
MRLVSNGTSVSHGIVHGPYLVTSATVNLAANDQVSFWWKAEGGGYFLETPNFYPADPLKTPPHIAPVWYFTPFYSILRAVTYPLFGIDAKFWGVVAMGAAVVIIAFLPWLDRSPVKSIRYRGPIFKTLLVFFVFSFLILGFLGTKPPEYAFFGVIPGAPVAQLMTLYYFLFFLTMPWWSKVDKCKPVPERVTFK